MMPSVRISEPRTRLAITTLVAAVLVFHTLPGIAETPADRVHLTLLHTSDSHGAVLPHDDTRDIATDHSLAQVAALVRGVRSEADHQVLVLDSGDTIQGSPFELFISVHWQRPSPTIDTMNRIGYDAMAVGNHEYNFGLEVLRRTEAQADFPFLSANAVHEDSGEPAFPPYKVVDVGGLKVGLLGLITPNIPGWERPSHYRGLRFEPMDEAAEKWLPKLRGDENCDLVVVLAHTGFEVDLESGASRDTGHEDYAVRLAAIDGIDVLLTGHSHRNIPPRELTGTIVSQPSSYARVVTRIDLELEKEDAGWRVADWNGVNLPMAEIAPDPEITTAWETSHKEVASALDATLTHATEAVSVEGCRLRDCAALDLIHAVQLQATGAQLSLASLLTDRTQRLDAGPLSWHWVYGLYVYPNTLLKVSVTGQQVKDILEHAALYYDGLQCSGDGRCTVLSNPDVRRYNVDSVAGLSYRIDPTRMAGDKVRDLRFGGHALDLHADFTLACNNYRAAGGGGFPHLADAEVLWTSSAEIAELIGAWLERHQPWHPEVDGNWFIGVDWKAEKGLSERR